MALLVFPILLLLEDAMGFTLAPAFGFLMSLVILPALPLLLFTNPSNVKEIIYVSSIISFVGLLISTQQQMFNQVKPQAMSFEYLQQQEKASIQALTSHPLPMKMIAESAFSNQQKISRPWSTTKYSSIEVQSLNLSVPELKVISIERQSGNITLEYQSKSSTDQFLIYGKQNNRLTNISIDKHRYEMPTGNETQYFLCRGIDCNGLVFTISYTGVEPLELGLINYQYGLPESLSYLTLTRGDNAQPIQTGDVTLVHNLVKLSKEISRSCLPSLS